MTLFYHELKQGRLALLIWSGIVAGMLAVCILIYPEMARQMEEVSGMFAEMGSFSAAFGMDRINFGEFIGFFGVECGNILGLGGGFFAAFVGSAALAKEEKEHTAEFLLTHPISRQSVVLQKFMGVLLQIAALNLVAVCVSVLSALVVGERPEPKLFSLLFAAYILLQIEIASICFGVSAFCSRGASGIGLGLAALFYFLNLIANLSEGAEFLKYLTPFGYAESADLIERGGINPQYLAVGLLLAAAGVLLAFVRYQRKDIL